MSVDTRTEEQKMVLCKMYEDGIARNRKDQARTIPREFDEILQGFVDDESARRLPGVGRRLEVEDLILEVWMSTEADDHTQERRFCVFAQAVLYIKGRGKGCAEITIVDRRDPQRKLHLRRKTKKTTEEEPWRCEHLQVASSSGRRAGHRVIGRTSDRSL